MIRIFLQKKNFNWLRLLTLIFTWVIAVAFVIHQYDVLWEKALIDSLIHTALAFLGLMILENAFSFYLPQGSFRWLRLVLTVLLIMGVVFFGNISLKYLSGSQADYLLFLDQTVWIRGLLLMVLFGSFTILIIYHTQLEDQLKILHREDQIEKMAKDAELYQLRQQLQPHFMFNSLNSINALIGKNPDQAREMILQLSDFLRGTIRKDDKKWISVSEELKYLELFLSIERIRFGNRLKVAFQVEDDAGSFKIPPLLIQPLLENAVKHGLNSLVGEVTLEMVVKKAGDYLEITITNPYDPGVGQVQGTGFGLNAVRRRLYLLFGRHDLLVVSPSGKYYTVRIKIPQLYDKDFNH